MPGPTRPGNIGELKEKAPGPTFFTRSLQVKIVEYLYTTVAIPNSAE